jgi:hypothetical protein
MGFWGLNWFEGDADLDAVSDLDCEAGLDKLWEETKEKVKQEAAQSGKPDATKSDDKAGEDEDGGYSDLSIYAGHCFDIELVRKHLDSGVLRKLIDKRKAIVARGRSSSAVYEFVLLGACAMTLGCKIPKDFKELLIEKYRSAHVLDDAVYSMQLALGDGPQRYKGEPYDFGSKGLIETANSLHDNQEIQPAQQQGHGHDVCGGCGAEDRLDGQPLLCCSKCKMQHYCGKVCQQAHHQKHQRLCKNKQHQLKQESKKQKQ